MKFCVKAGTSVRITRPIELEPYGTVDAGAVATVLVANEEERSVLLSFEAPHEALYQWRNTLYLQEQDTSDINDAFTWE